MRVQQFYNRNQFIIDDINKKNEVIFQSYKSIVAIYNLASCNLILGRHWDYSNTTLKHLYLFIKDYVISDKLEELQYKKNKKEYIQYLIDNQFINYDKSLI